MAITTTTNTADIIEKVVSTIVTETLQQRSVMMGAVEDRSSEVRPGMDQLDIPLYDEMVLQDVLQAGEVTPQDITLATVKLILDRHKSMPFAIGDRTMTQSKGDLIGETVKKGAITMAAEVDDYLIGLIDAGATSRNALTAGAAGPLDDISNARKVLNQNNVPMANRFLLVSPAFEAAILKTNTFIDASQYGSASPIQAGEIGRVLGFTVLMSSSAAVQEDGFIAFERSACFFARQISPKFESDRNVLGHRDEYSLSHLYGALLSGNGAAKAVVYDADGVL